MKINASQSSNCRQGVRMDVPLLIDVTKTNHQGQGRSANSLPSKIYRTIAAIKGPQKYIASASPHYN